MTLLRRCNQYQIVRMKETFDPLASDIDTLVKWAVTVYPIYVN